MEEKVVARSRDWVEPAHPTAVKHYEDLIIVYRIIRERLQRQIDEAFDSVAREIGFVVTTTLPVTLEIADKGKARWGLAETLKGSLFEKAILKAVGDPIPELAKISPGTYRLYLVWFDALKLKLRKDWLEPAHFLRRDWVEPAHFLSPDILERITEVARVRPEVMEPAHWFHPGVVILAEEQIVISAMDEVYPELRLAERIAATRQLLRRVRPEVMEPAHLRPELGAGLALREIATLLRRVRPEVMEPAHFRPFERDLLGEIQSVLSKYGV